MKVHCENCGSWRDASAMDYYLLEAVPEGCSVEYSYDLVDGYFCRGVFAATENDDPTQPDNYEPCINEYCRRRE
jgi:hypothetical protein